MAGFSPIERVAQRFAIDTDDSPRQRISVTGWPNDDVGAAECNVACRRGYHRQRLRLSFPAVMGPNDFSPIELDDRIRRGDSAAFETLFRTHYDALCAFAIRYSESSAIAEELVQDVFARVWTDHVRWPAPQNQRAYLFTAVRNRALNVGRRRQLEEDWIEGEIAVGREADDSADLPLLARIADPDAHDHLERAVASLPERCRLVMHLRWRESMSYADIAAIMGISTKGVENQLSRGLRALRRAFGVAH